VSSDSIVKGIIDDIIKTAVKTAEVDEQKTKRKHEKVISQLYKVNTEQNIYNILLINMIQSCQIKQRYTFHLHPAFIGITLVSNIILKVYM
jgi:hypothetical protein